MIFGVTLFGVASPIVVAVRMTGMTYLGVATGFNNFNV